MSAKDAVRRSPRQQKLSFAKRKPDEAIVAKATAAPKRKAAVVAEDIDFPAQKHTAAGKKGKAAAVADKDANATTVDPIAIAAIAAAREEVETSLKKFDLCGLYGPLVGMKRIDRWNRAHHLGLEPPLAIKKLIESHDSEWPLWHDAEGNTPF